MNFLFVYLFTRGVAEERSCFTTAVSAYVAAKERSGGKSRLLEEQVSQDVWSCK